MSNTNQVKKIAPAKSGVSVESVIEAVKAFGFTDCVVLVGTHEPEVSGVVFAKDGTIYRDIVPLGQGVTVVFTFDLPTNFEAGVHEL